MTGAMLTGDVEHVINLPSKGAISLFTDKDLKYTDTRDLHKIRNLLRVLDHIVGMKLNTGITTGLQLRTASAPSITDLTKEIN